MNIFSKEYCYNRMIKDGNFNKKNKKCNGRVGGDNATNYLSYDCMVCKYFDENLFRKVK